MSKLALVIASLLLASAVAEPKWRHFFHQADLIWGLSFPEPDYGFCTQFRSGTPPEAGSGLMKTVDGRNFDKLYDTPGIFMLQSVAFEDRSKGVAGGMNLFLPSRMYSTDGGNFTYSEGIGGGVEQIGEIYTFPGQPGKYLAVGDFGNDSGFSISSNGGKTWTPQASWGWQGQGSPQDAAIIDSNTFIIAGGRWPRRDDEEVRAQGTKVLEINEFASYVVGGANAGLELDFASTEEFRTRALKGRSTDNIYVAVIQKTTDGGKTFKNVFHDENNFYFQGISCVSASVCYATATAGASGGWLFKSTDGGDSWKELEFFPQQPMGPIQFFDEKTGWIGGGNTQSGKGYALFTKDGGQTWKTHKLLDMLLQFDLSAPDNGWATGITISMRAGDLLQLRDLDA